MQINQKLSKKITSSANSGFTILELLIIILLVGIIFAIAYPSWLNFVERQRLNKAQNQVYLSLQSAKSNALREKMTWQVSFREQAGVVQWAVHGVQESSSIPTNLPWNSLDSNIQIYKNRNKKGSCETTFYQRKQQCPTIGPWRVQFNHKGNTNGQLGQLTLISKNPNKYQRCVYVSTLIGSIKIGKENIRSNSSNKYCY
ncbi:MAG: prepilin-type cleavage/methylation domain-containing protein [Coleofasciculaceae cyanobacterium]